MGLLKHCLQSYIIIIYMVYCYFIKIVEMIAFWVVASLVWWKFAHVLEVFTDGISANYARTSYTMPYTKLLQLLLSASVIQSFRMIGEHPLSSNTVRHLLCPVEFCLTLPDTCIETKRVIISFKCCVISVLPVRRGFSFDRLWSGLLTVRGDIGPLLRQGKR
jgi:hypothetical protein